MASDLGDLRVLQTAEKMSDEVWNRVIAWKEFARDTVGKQLVRATDSVGANIAESFGRFNYGEKLQFLYFARGSLYETKYWLNRCTQRHLIDVTLHQEYSRVLGRIAQQLNAFAKSMKSQRAGMTATPKQVLHDATAHYEIGEPEVVIPNEAITWLVNPDPCSTPPGSTAITLQSLISNL